MTVAHLDPLTDPRWAAFVMGAPEADVFHHPAWLSLLHEHYRYPMQALCVLEHGEMVAGLPLARVESRMTGRRLVAVPFSDRCVPLGGARAVQHLGEALVAQRALSGLDIELRAPLEGLPGAIVVARFLQHRLVLAEGPESIMKAARSQVRRGIAKARRSGVSIERDSSRRALEAFYRLHLRTRRRQGVPTQPKGFILGFEHLFAQGLGFVLLAYHEQQAVAAAVFLSSGGTLTYKYGASDERFLTLRPNNLLFAEAIRIGCEEGLRMLDFGRTDLDNTGLASFKRSWGAAEESVSYTYLADGPPRTGTGVAGRLLAHAIRRTPPFTGRAIGTALYRHVG